MSGRGDVAAGRHHVGVSELVRLFGKVLFGLNFGGLREIGFIALRHFANLFDVLKSKFSISELLVREGGHTLEVAFPGQV